MHPSAPTGAAPGPADPIQSQVAHLEDVMAQAEIAANAQRDIESGASTPTEQPARQEATAADEDEGDDSEASEPGDELQDDEEEDEGEESEEGDEERTEPPAQPQAEQPRYSRRDAARFASELEAHKRDLEQARAQLREFQGAVAHHQASDQQVRQLLSEQSGYTREANGRFRYENLSEKVLKGTATPEETEEVNRMSQWAEFAGPIYRAAQEIAWGSVATEWGSLKDLDGIGDKGLEKLNKAPNSIAASKELHAMAFAAGEAKAKATAEQTIAKLRGELKQLKTGKVASAPQPATANGAAVPTKGGFLTRAIDPKTGLSNPDFDREVASGRWLGADLTQN